MPCAGRFSVAAQGTSRERNPKCGGHDPTEEQAGRQRRSRSELTIENPFDAFRQSGPCDACHKCHWRSKAEAAHLEDGLGVAAIVRSHLQYLLVAGAFPFAHELRPDPPHYRMKPEDSLDDHLDQCGQIVPAGDVTRLMREERLELRVRQSIRQPVWPEKLRVKCAEHARFDAGIAAKELDADGTGHTSRHSSEGFGLTALFEGRQGLSQHRECAPLPPAPDCQAHDSRRPEGRPE